MSDQYLSASIAAPAALSCDARVYRISAFTWSGDIAVGVTIEIDVENCTVEVNGVDDVSDFAGELFNIQPGTNVLTYTDAEGSRTMRLKVVKRDRQA